LFQPSMMTTRIFLSPAVVVPAQARAESRMSVQLRRLRMRVSPRKKRPTRSAWVEERWPWLLEDHFLEVLERQAADDGLGRLGLYGPGRAGLRVAALALGLRGTDALLDFQQSGQLEDAGAFLADLALDVLRQGVEDAADLLLGQAGLLGQCGVHFGLGCCLR